MYKRFIFVLPRGTKYHDIAVHDPCHGIWYLSQVHVPNSISALWSPQPSESPFSPGVVTASIASETASAQSSLLRASVTPLASPTLTAPAAAPVTVPTPGVTDPTTAPPMPPAIMPSWVASPTAATHASTDDVLELEDEELLDELEEEDPAPSSAVPQPQPWTSRSRSRVGVSTNHRARIAGGMSEPVCPKICTLTRHSLSY